MKNYKLLFLVLVLAITGVACKKDSTTTPATNPVVGSWRVSSFVEDNVDVTSQFNGYTFNCNSNGGLTIQGNGYNYPNCSWENNDMMSGSVCHFQIMGCDTTSVLWYCDEDWDLNSSDSQHCNFTDHNPNHHSSMTWVRI